MYQVEKMASDSSDKLSEETKTNMSARLEEARTALETDDVDTMEETYKVLETALHAAAQELYAQTAQQEEQPFTPPDVEEDIIDAEFQEAV